MGLLVSNAMGLYFRRTYSGGAVHANLPLKDGGYSSAIPGFDFPLKQTERHFVLDGRGSVYLARPDFFGDHQSLAAHKPLDENRLSAYLVAVSQSHTPQSRETLIAMLNRAHASVPWSFIALILTTAVSCVLGMYQVIVGCVALLVGLSASAWLLHHQHRKYVVTLEYILQGSARSSAQHVFDGLNALATCAQLWQVNGSQRVGDIHEWKRQAGASTLVSRRSTRCGREDPPWVQCNIPVPCLKVSEATFYFFPDFLLLRSADGYSTLEYDSLSLHAGVTRFIEEGSLPSDASVVEHTWKHPNKSGGPDKRFASNYEIPICEYGSLRISTPILHAVLQTSHRNAATKMALVFGKAQESRAQAMEPTTTEKNKIDTAIASTSTTKKQPTISPTSPLGTADLDRMADEIEREERQRLAAFKRGC